MLMELSSCIILSNIFKVVLYLRQALDVFHYMMIFFIWTKKMPCTFGKQILNA